MIMPRVSAVRRVVVLVGVLVVCGWVWLTAPINTQPDLMPDVHNLVNVREEAVTRKNTLVEASKNDKLSAAASENENKEKSEHTHHHSNDTLEHLRKNMTLLRANMSGVESIMLKFNKTNQKGKATSHNVDDYINNQGSLANPHPFKYIINAKGVCRDKDVFLVVYIHTAPSHYKRRMIIRETWGNRNNYDVQIRVVFVMGNTTDKPEVQQALLFESETYGDIVQEDFQDTYKNLTYKGIAGLKWVSNYCRHAKFVLKSDDDIFVNMFTLLKHLGSLNRLGVDNKGTILCLVWYKMKVMREGKWKIDESEWKDDYYPTYCSGSAFTMSTDVAVAMHNVSYHVPFFWVDDFYITGLLPLKLDGKVKHKQFMSTYVLDGKKLEEKFTGPQWFTYIFSHVHDLDAIQNVWAKLLKLSTGELQPEVKFALPGQLPKEDKKPNKG